jgi:hypothetical protein
VPLLDDQKLVSEGREGKLDVAPADLRDRIDSKLLEKLREDKFGHKISELWLKANADRSDRLQRRQTYLSDWDQFMPSESDGPYQGTSDLHLPVSFTVLKTYHARMYQAIMGELPMPKARRPDAIEREKLVYETMKYALKDWSNEREGLDAAVDAWLWEWCGYGAGTLKARWEAKFERFTDVVTVQSTRSRSVVDAFGNERTIQEPFQEEKEQEKVEPVFDGPMVDFVAEEDLVCVGGEGDPQKADVAAHSQWLTASDLWTYSDRKIFDEEAVKKIIKATEDLKSGDPSGDIKQQKAILSGQSNVDVDSDHERYQLIEAYCSYDVWGSGVNSEIVAWIHPKTCEITRATFLRRLNKTGKRPFFRAEFFKRPGAEHPMGLIEILYPIAKEIDVMHNMKVDAGLFSAMPFFFYRASSSLKPEVIRYEPGMGIPVDDPTRDVFFPQLGNRALFGAQEEAGLYTLVERLTGINDLTLGAMSGTQGAARTATGVRGLTNEANSNLDIHLKRLYKAWRQFLKYFLCLLQQRMPPGLSFRVTGEDGQNYFAYIPDRTYIYGDFDFEIDPSSADSNPQVRVEKATQVFNMVMNPLLIQTGAVSPRNIFEAAKNLLTASGIKDWGRFITEPQGMPLMLSPREEALRVLNGEQVPVGPQGDHQGFLDFFQFLMSNPELLGSFGEHEAVALQAQAKKHQEMAQALQQMQAQQANLSQMRSNAANSQQQAPVAMSPTAGPGQVMA